MLPSKRILITADLDQPSFGSYAKDLIESLSYYRVPLTLFSINESQDGEKAYSTLKEIMEFAKRKNLVLEIGSHSIRHTSLANKAPSEILSVIMESIRLFKKEGIPVYGFRSPGLSTERSYRAILKELSTSAKTIRYDSSTLFEGNLFFSKIYDLFRFYWKCPHKVGDIWELPISCLDDYHLFNKLKKNEEFVVGYWKRKVETCLHNYNYFLLLIHPQWMVNHLSVLEEFLAYCDLRYPKSCFTTCLGLIEELNLLKKEKEQS